MTLTVGPAGRETARPGGRAVLVPPVAMAAAAVAGTALLASWDPHTHHVPLCPVHAVTGLWCPLCGGLRAVNDLTASHWLAALSDNALVVLLLPLAVLWWCAWMVRARAGRLGTPTVAMAPRTRRWSWILVVTVVLAYAVLRNLPAGAWLAPAS